MFLALRKQRAAAFFAAGLGWSATLHATALSDQMLSSSYFVSQGAAVDVRHGDALSWAQSPALLADIDSAHFSSGTFYTFSSLKPQPEEKSARGAQVLGYAAKAPWGSLGLAVSLPLGQNVWVDTGPRQSTTLFSLSRMSSFSVGLGWAHKLGEDWSLGLQIPIIFRSNTITDIYLTDDNPWARARTGIQPYFGLQVGLKKSWNESGHLMLSFRDEQASQIEFSVRGEVDFASINLPLNASGLSRILFEPRRLDLQAQRNFSQWTLGAFVRWSHWKSAPPLGLVIDSEIPQTTTEASRVRWQDQWELATSASYRLTKWTPTLAYRYRSKAVVSSNDYLDYNEHIVGLGAHVELLLRELWISAAVRTHFLSGGGTLVSVLTGIDWSL